MAKPTVTEQDVSAGIKSLGGFGGLTRTSTNTTRRDSPFGSSFAKPQQQPDPTPAATASAAAATAQTPPAPTPAPTTAAPAPASAVEAKLAEKRVGELRERTTQPVQPAPAQTTQPEPTGAPPPRTATPVVQETPLAEPPPLTPRASRKGAGKATPPSTALTSIPKTELYTERVTVLMDAAMRDELNRVAHLLQRRKSDSTERITANTITRVAVRLFLEQLRPTEADAPKTEAELYQLTKAKIDTST